MVYAVIVFVVCILCAIISDYIRDSEVYSTIIGSIGYGGLIVLCIMWIGKLCL